MLTPAASSSVMVSVAVPEVRPVALPVNYRLVALVQAVPGRVEGQFRRPAGLPRRDRHREGAHRRVVRTGGGRSPGPAHRHRRRGRRGRVVQRGGHRHRRRRSAHAHGSRVQRQGDRRRRRVVVGDGQRRRARVQPGRAAGEDHCLVALVKVVPARVEGQRRRQSGILALGIP